MKKRQRQLIQNIMNQLKTRWRNSMFNTSLSDSRYKNEMTNIYTQMHDKSYKTNR